MINFQENFCLIKDKYVLERNYDLSYTQCYACNLKSHNLEGCPRLHVIPDKSFLIRRYNHYYPIVTRVPYGRRNKRSSNTRLNLTNLAKETIRFSLNLEKNLINKNEDDQEDDEIESNDSSLTHILEEDTQQKTENNSTKMEESSGIKEAKDLEDIPNEFIHSNIRVSEVGNRENEPLHIHVDRRPSQARNDYGGCILKNLQKDRRGSVARGDNFEILQRNRRRSMVRRDDFGGYTVNGESPAKRGMIKEIWKEEETGRRRKRCSTLNNVAFRRGSETMGWPEGIEVGKEVNRDSKKQLYRTNTIIKEDFDFMFR